MTGKEKITQRIDSELEALGSKSIEKKKRASKKETVVDVKETESKEEEVKG